GRSSSEISVEVKKSSARPATSVFRATSRYEVDGPQAVKLESASEAAQYRPGDWVSLAGPDTRVQVTSVSGVTLRLGTQLTGAASKGALRLADSPTGARTVRLQPNPPATSLPPGALAPGTMLTITQGQGKLDTQIVDSVQIEQLATSTTYRVTFRQGLAIALD